MPSYTFKFVNGDVRVTGDFFLFTTNRGLILEAGGSEYLLFGEPNCGVRNVNRDSIQRWNRISEDLKDYLGSRIMNLDTVNSMKSLLETIKSRYREEGAEGEELIKLIDEFINF